MCDACENLHRHIEKLEVEKQSEVAQKVKAVKHENNLHQSKHEKVCKDMKNLQK